MTITFTPAFVGIEHTAKISTTSVEPPPAGSTARPSCEGASDDWDLDVGSPNRWQQAVHICRACPLLGQCREFAEKLIARGDAPRAMIWAGVGYDNSGRVVRDLDRYRPTPIDRNRPLRIIRNAARTVRSEAALVAPHRHIILGRPLEPTGTGRL